MKKIEDGFYDLIEPSLPFTLSPLIYVIAPDKPLCYVLGMAGIAGYTLGIIPPITTFSQTLNVFEKNHTVLGIILLGRLAAEIYFAVEIIRNINNYPEYQSQWNNQMVIHFGSWLILWIGYEYLRHYNNSELDKEIEALKKKMDSISFNYDLRKKEIKVGYKMQF